MGSLANFNLNSDPIGNILSKVSDFQKMRGESQRQRLAENTDREGTSKYGVEQGYVTPQYDDQGNFKGYAKNQSAYDSDLPMMKKDLPQVFPKPQQPQAPVQQQAPQDPTQDPIIAASQARNRAMGIDPSAGGQSPPSPQSAGQQGQPPQPMVPPDHAEAIRAASSPQQMPGDPKPLLTDPKVNHEIAKVAAQAPTGGITVAPNAPVSFGDLPVQAPPSAPAQANADQPSPHLMNRIAGYMTTMPHYQMDPEIPIASLAPSDRTAAGYTQEDADSGTSVRRSILQERMKGNYGLEKAKITANGLGLPGSTAPYLDGVTRGIYGSPAEALQHYEQDQGPLPPRQAQAFLKAGGSAFNNMNANRSFGLRQDSQNERIAGQGAAAVDNNPVVRIYQQRLDGAKKSLELIGGMRKDPSDPAYVMPSAENLHQLSNEIGKLETGSNTVAEGNLEAGEIVSKEAQLKRLYSQWSGDVTPAQIGPQLIQAEQLIHNLSGSYQGILKDQVSRIGAGRGPKQQAAINQKAATMDSTNQVPAQSYQTEIARAQQLLSQYSAADKGGKLPAGAAPYPSKRRQVEQYLQQKYGKGLGTWQAP